MEKLSEFEAIKKYFSFSNSPNNLSSVQLGVGDDAAVLVANPNSLVIASELVLQHPFLKNHSPKYHH